MNDLGRTKFSALCFGLGLGGSLLLAATTPGCGREDGVVTGAATTPAAAVEQRSDAVVLGQARSQGQAFLLGNRLTLSWIDNLDPPTGSPGQSSHVWSIQVNDATGATFTPPRILTYDANTQGYPRVAVHTSGTGALLAYEDTTPQTPGPNIKAMLLDSNGVSAGPAILLHTNTGSGDHIPRVIYNSWAGQYLVVWQGGDNWTRGVEVDQGGTKGAVYSVGITGQATSTDIDVISAASPVATVQLAQFGNQFLSSTMLGNTTPTSTHSISGTGRLATKLLYDSASGRLGILGLTYSAPNVFAGYFQTMPFVQCSTTGTCPQTSILVGTSTSTVGQSAPWAAQMDMRAFTSAVVGGKFLVAARGLATNQVSGPPPQGASIEIRSINSAGVQTNLSYRTSSCGIREFIGIGTGPTASWLFWSCANGEIRGFKIDANATVLSNEALIVQ